MKKRKIIIPMVIALLALIIVLALILSRCNAQPDETLDGSTNSSRATGSTSSSTGAEVPGSSVPATTVPSSTPATGTPPPASTAPSTTPTQSTGSTKPTTKPTTPTTVPTTVPTQPTTKPNGCSHTFTEWAYEEYTYEAYNLAGKLKTYTSHRKVRTCTKCGYKETGGTPDHRCTWGCSNHTVTTIEEAICDNGALYRSTCTVCGWYEEQRSDETNHSWKSETRHLADYGDYTNELDVRISTCTVCGTQSITYIAGEGWSEYVRMRNSISITGDMYANTPKNNDSRYLDHPTWQTVRRDFVYDSDGYVKQFTVYWWYNGSRYSQVIKCGEGEIEAWFAEYGISVSGTISGYTLYCTGTKLVPYKVAYTG